MDIDECNGRRLYTALTLDYRLRRWAPTSASRAISAVAELLVIITACRNIARCISYSISVRPSVRRTPVLCQNERM